MRFGLIVTFGSVDALYSQLPNAGLALCEEPIDKGIGHLTPNLPTLWQTGD